MITLNWFPKTPFQKLLSLHPGNRIKKNMCIILQCKVRAVHAILESVRRHFLRDSRDLSDVVFFFFLFFI